MDMDSALDFEKEDLLLPSPVLTKRRKKIIGLDDLLEEFKESKEEEKRKQKRAKTRKMYNSDDDQNDKEAALSRAVDECHKQVNELSGEEENSSWGMCLFQNQKPRPIVKLPELDSVMLLQSCMNSEINSLLKISPGKEMAFFEGFLVNGWLLQLVFTCGYLENFLAIWIFNLMLYSSREELRMSACDFWCAIVLPKEKDGLLPRKIEWYPCYTELKNALETYGFVSNFTTGKELLHGGSGCSPPQNIRCWIKFVNICCQVRSKLSIFSPLEAEELAEVIICLSLDRHLQGLSLLLHECLQSTLKYFTDTEWTSSCDRISNSLAFRVPKDLNCVQTVEYIGGDNIRSEQLRSAVSYKFLVSCFGDKATDEEILESLVSINVKEKSCDLLRMYIYLILVENWLLFNPALKDKSAVSEMWGLLLRNWSCQIASTDLRSYASKVRDKASYLLQGTGSK